MNTEKPASVACPDVCIVLLHRNRSAYLEECLASISIQTHSNWCLLFSDNSSDPSEASTAAELVETFRLRHPDKEVTSEFRGGTLSFPEHLQLCISESTSEYTAIHNDDDVWLPFHLEQSLTTLKSLNAAIVTCNSMGIDSSGNITHEALYPRDLKKLPYKNIVRYFLSSAYGSLAGITFLTKALQPFPALKSDIIDVAMIVACMGQGKKVAIMFEPTFRYRMHSNGVTGTANAKVAIQRLKSHRMEMRFWAFRNYFWTLTIRCPTFPCLLLKDSISRLAASFGGRP